jgi:hypothetical protein
MEKRTMKRVGFALMAVGFLFAAFFVVSQIQHVSLAHYLPAFIATALGAALLRLSQRVTSGEQGRITKDLDTINQSLTELVDHVTQLNSARDTIDVFDFPARIDSDCMENINDFVEAREAMIHRYGLDTYAGLMDCFALGERALNRAWCAAADGYVDELYRCLDRAERYFKQARDVAAAAAEPVTAATESG